MESIKRFINRYGAWVIVAGVAGYLIYQYNAHKPDIEAGEMAPQFELIALDGNTYNNSSFEGQFVLIDFWGSWCFPCRAANAELKSLYREVQANEKYRKNFNLISIGYESDSVKWLKAIEDQKLTWPIHVMEDQKGNTPLTHDFKIVAFPTNFLINPDGRIVGVNVSPTAVIKRLKEM